MYRYFQLAPLLSCLMREGAEWGRKEGKTDYPASMLFITEKWPKTLLKILCHPRLRICVIGRKNLLPGTFVLVTEVFPRLAQQH